VRALALSSFMRPDSFIDIGIIQIIYLLTFFLFHVPLFSDERFV